MFARLKTQDASNMKRISKTTSDQVLKSINSPLTAKLNSGEKSLKEILIHEYKIEFSNEKYKT